MRFCNSDLLGGSYWGFCNTDLWSVGMWNLIDRAVRREPDLQELGDTVNVGFTYHSVLQLIRCYTFIRKTKNSDSDLLSKFQFIEIKTFCFQSFKNLPVNNIIHFGCSGKNPQIVTVRMAHNGITVIIGKINDPVLS